MSLKAWENNGWLRPHQTSEKEITNLLAIVERDLADASGDVSTDARFGSAYNAALKLCTILLYASGYRSDRGQHHYYTLQSMSLILGQDRKIDADYLDACRKKRHIVEYDYVGGVTEDELRELIAFTKMLKDDVIKWLYKNHPDLTNILKH